MMHQARRARVCADRLWEDLRVRDPYRQPLTAELLLQPAYQPQARE